MTTSIRERKHALFARAAALESAQAENAAWEALEAEASREDFPFVEHAALLGGARELRRAGDSFGAEHAFHRAIEIASRSLGADHTSTLETSLELAEHLAAAGRIDDAIGIAESARAVAVAAGQDALLVARATSSVGRRLCESAMPAEGYTLLRRALDTVWVARTEAASARDVLRRAQASLLGAQLAVDLAELPSDGTGPDRGQLRALASRWFGDAVLSDQGNTVDAACSLAMTWLALAFEDAPYASTAALFAAFALRVAPPSRPTEAAAITRSSHELLASLGARTAPCVADAFHLLESPFDVVAVAHPLRGFYLGFRERIDVRVQPSVGRLVHVEVDERDDLVRVVEAR